MCYFSVLRLYSSLCQYLLGLILLREARSLHFLGVFERIKGDSKIYILPGKGGAKDFLQEHAQEVAFKGHALPIKSHPSHFYVWRQHQLREERQI